MPLSIQECVRLPQSVNRPLLSFAAGPIALFLTAISAVPLCPAQPAGASRPADPAQLAGAQQLTRQVRALALQGNYSEAANVGKRLLELRERLHGRDHRAVRRTLLELVPAAALGGDLERAQEWLARACQGDSDASRALCPTLPRLLGELASVQRAAGRAAEARVTLEKAADLARRLAPSIARPDDWHGLARLLRETGDLTGARQLYERCLESYEATRESTGLAAAAVMQDLAHVLAEQGDLDAARPLLERAVAIDTARLAPDDPQLSTALNNMAFILHDVGELAAARRLFERVLQSQERSRQSTDPALAVPMNNLAALLQDLGELDRARELFARALALLESSLGPVHPRVAAALSSLAMLERARKDLKAARSLLERSLELRQASFGPHHLETARSRHRLAIVLFESGDLDAARRESMQAFASQAEVAETVMPALSDTERLAFVDMSRQFLHHLLSCHERPTDGRAAYEAVLRWKGLAWRMLVRSVPAAEAETDPVRAGLRAELEQCRRDLAVAFGARAAGQELEGVRGLEALTERKEKLERDLAARGGKAPAAPPTFEALQSRLPPCQSLADFVVYQRWQAEPASIPVTSLAAFVVTTGTTQPVRVELGPLEPIREAAAAWYRTVTTKGAPERIVRKLGAGLSRSLWAPVEAALPATGGVIVCPDGPVCRVPFEALPDGEDRYLVERRDFSLVTASEDLLRSGPETAATTSQALLLVGGIDYERIRPAAAGETAEPALPTTSAGPAPRGVDTDTSRSQRFEPLPGAREEIDELSRLFGSSKAAAGPVRLLDTDRVNKTDLIRSVRGCRWVHLATHGFWDQGAARSATDCTAGAASGSPWGLGRNPLLFAGLALSGANLGRSFVLSGEEAANLPLAGADLVTLSACESGLGEVRSGEGVLGMRRAILAAGARAVVSALWPVPDLQTRQLMTEFYKQIWLEALRPAEALSQAKRRWLEGARTRQESTAPRNWAGFVVTLRQW